MEVSTHYHDKWTCMSGGRASTCADQSSGDRRVVGGEEVVVAGGGLGGGGGGHRRWRWRRRAWTVGARAVAAAATEEAVEGGGGVGWREGEGGGGRGRWRRWWWRGWTGRRGVDWVAGTAVALTRIPMPRSQLPNCRHWCSSAGRRRRTDLDWSNCTSQERDPGKPIARHVHGSSLPRCQSSSAR